MLEFTPNIGMYRHACINARRSQRRERFKDSDYDKNPCFTNNKRTVS